MRFLRGDARFLLLGALTLLAPAARADEVLPGAFGYVAPLWLACLTFGLSFVTVVLIEAGVFAAVLRVRLVEAGKLALAANAITTAYGALFFVPPASLLALNVLLAIVLLPVLAALKSESRRHRALLAVLVLAPIPSMLAVIPAMQLFPEEDIGMIVASLVPAFLVSALIEWFTLRAMCEAPRRFVAAVAANASSYGLIALALWVSGVGALDNPLRNPYFLTEGARGLLRLGEVERAMHIAETVHEIELQEPLWPDQSGQPTRPSRYGFRIADALLRTMRPRVRSLEAQNQPSPDIYGKPARHSYYGLKIAYAFLRTGHPQEALRAYQLVASIPDLAPEDLSQARDHIGEIEAALAGSPELVRATGPPPPTPLSTAPRASPPRSASPARAPPR
jgi:hypothetical protein